MKRNKGPIIDPITLPGAASQQAPSHQHNPNTGIDETNPGIPAPPGITPKPKPPIPEHKKTAGKYTDRVIKVKPWIEFIGFFVLFSYTIFAGCQSYSMRVANRISRDANRPYVGVDNVSATYLYMDANGTEQSSRVPTKDTRALQFTASIKNFGPTPGLKYRSNWRVSLNGTQMPIDNTVGYRPSTIFPGQSTLMIGGILKDYPLVVSGKEKLVLDITVEYAWPGGDSKDCREEQYMAQYRAFADLGPLCAPE